MYVKYWLGSKDITKHNSQVVIWSIISSVIITSCYKLLHIWILSSWNVPEPLKILVYIMTALAAAFLVYFIKESSVFKVIIQKLCYKTPNDNIFDDLIDYKKNTDMIIYLKAGNYYLGKFCMLSDDKSWIALANYKYYNSKTLEVEYVPSWDETCVVIPMSEIMRIEIMYEPNSTTWNNIKPEK